MISKKTFVEVIKAIQEQDEIDSAFGKALETVCDSWCIYGTMDKQHGALAKVLTEIFQDEGDWISWWLFEDVEKVVTYSDKRKKTVLKTPEQLYDFLLKNMEEKKQKGEK